MACPNVCIIFEMYCIRNFGRLVQKRRNSIANALELRLSYTKPSNKTSAFYAVVADGQKTYFC